MAAAGWFLGLFVVKKKKKKGRCKMQVGEYGRWMKSVMGKGT